jgi:hypothetical protein
MGESGRFIKIMNTARNGHSLLNSLLNCSAISFGVVVVATTTMKVKPRHREYAISH